MRYAAWSLRMPNWLTWKRWMVIVFVLGSIHASSYALLVPPWQAPDEPGHFEYGCLLEPLGRPLSRDALSLILQHEILVSMNRNNFWELVGEPQPERLSQPSIDSGLLLLSTATGNPRVFLPIAQHHDPFPLGFSDIPFLLKSGRQVGDEPRLYYVVPSVICHMALPIESRLLLTRLYGAVIFGLVGSVTAWGLIVAGHRCSGGATNGLFAPIREDETLTKIAMMVSAGSVLLPMPAFLAGSVNNDVLAVLTGATVFAIATRIHLDGVTKKRVVGLLAILMIALLSKKTTLFLLPWIVTYGLLGMILATKMWNAKRLVCRKMKIRLRRCFAVLLLGVVIVIAGLQPRSSSSAAWTSNLQPFASGVSRAKIPDGDISNWVYLIVDNTTETSVSALQWVEGRDVLTLSGQILEGVVYVRSLYGQIQTGCLVVSDSHSESTQLFVAGPIWRRVSLTHAISQDAGRIQLSVAAGRCGQLSDTAELIVDEAALMDSSGNNLLSNSGFERSGNWLGWFFSNLRKVDAIHALLDDIKHSVGGLFFRLNEMKPEISSTKPMHNRHVLSYLKSIALLFPSFWGNFGWLQRPLPIALYGAIAGLCGLVVIGLVRTLHSAETKSRRIVWYWVSGLGLAVAQAIMPMIGHDWQPQGRYLFPALFPIVGLLVIGLYHWDHVTQGAFRVWHGFLFLLMLDVISLYIASQSHV